MRLEAFLRVGSLLLIALFRDLSICYRRLLHVLVKTYLVATLKL